MKLKLHDSVSSPEDLKAIILELRQYAVWFSNGNVKKHLSVNNTSPPPAISTAAIELIKDWSGEKPLSQAGLDDLISDMEMFADTAPTLTVTLAAAPSSGLKKTLVEGFRKNIEPDILVSFQFNSTILGGMVVRYGSQIFDWSFRRQILAARSHFSEVLRNV